MRAWIIAAALGSGSVGMVACLLAIPDVVSGSVDGAADAMLPMCDGGCGAPVGFAPLLIALDAAPTCPSNMTALDLAADPAVGSACDCDCNVTEQPSCQHYDIWGDDAGAACAGQMVYVSGLNATCQSYWPGMMNSPHWSFVGHPETGDGGCTSKPANDAGGVTATQARVCIDTSCSGSCASVPGFKTCFYATGHKTCPYGLTVYDLGKPSVSCAACSACSVTSPCEGSITFFSDYSCQNATGYVGSSNTCLPAQSSPAVAYVFDAGGPLTCKGGTSTGTVTLDQELTVCCP